MTKSGLFRMKAKSAKTKDPSNRACEFKVLALITRLFTASTIIDNTTNVMAVMLNTLGLFIILICSRTAENLVKVL